MPKRVLFLSVLLLLCLVAACGPSVTGPTQTQELPEGPERDLAVTFASPQGEMETLEDSQAILVGFNQPMVFLQPLPVEETIGPLTIEPPINGKFRWKGTATLAFLPSEPLPYGTHFKVTLQAGLRPLRGKPLAESYVFEFDTPRPRLVSASPENNDRWIRPDRVIFLRFNQPVDPQRLESFVHLVAIEPEKSTESKAAVTLRRLTEAEMEQFQGPRPAGEEGPDPRLERCVAVVPSKPLVPGYSYRVVLLKGLVGAQGTLGSSEEKTVQFSTYGKFEATGMSRHDDKDVNPEYGLTFSFSNPVSYGEFSKNVQFEPPVEIPDSYREDESTSEDIYFYVPLKPRTAYRVSVLPALKDQFGNELGKKAEYSFKTGDLTPQVMMPAGTAVLESTNKTLRIPVGLLNINKAVVQAAELDDQEVLDTLSDYDRLGWGESSYTPSKGWDTTLRLERTTQPNVVQDRFVEVAPLLNGKRSGWLYLSLKAADNDRRLLVQVTNLGVSAKFGPENTVVFVSTLDKAQPVPNAAVELRNLENKVLWSGKTGADGTVSAPGWSSLGLPARYFYEQPSLMVFARSGNDRALVGNNFNWSISPWQFDLDTDYTPRLPDLRGHAFSERGLYRAGEEVYLKGALRELKTGKFMLPELKQVDFKVMDSRDQLVQLGVADLSDFGSFDHTVKLAPGAPTGYYSVYYYPPGGARKSLKDEGRVELLAYTSFRVEAFRPAQFEVKVETDKPSYAFGDKVEATLTGRYLFGGVMKGDDLSWSARVEPMYFAPPGWDGFDFGPLRWLDDVPMEEAKTLLSGKGALDDEGKKKLAVDLEGVNYTGSAALVVEGTVTSPSRQQISGRASLMVHPGSFLIGIKPRSSFNTAGSAVTLDVVTTDPEGKALPGNKIHLELIRRDWHSVRRAEAGGDYRWVTTHEDQKVSDTAVESGDQVAVASLTPTKPGFYLVRATGEDRAGRKIETVSSFYASGSEYVAWAREEGDQIDLVADKKSYKPGETARILVKSPYEKCTALVTVEREMIMRRFVTELNGSAPTVEIPIQSEDLPNAYVSVMLFSGRVSDDSFSETGEDLGKPSFKIGYVNLPVDTGEKHLKVVVKTDREDYRPGDTVTVDLEVQNYEGKGVRAEVDLAVVDRGVLNLIQYATPDLFDPFYGPRSLRVSTAETRLDVIGLRSYGTKGESEGGGGGLDPTDLREDFKATPYWNPRVLTDATGKARVTFELPDNLTSFRVMATALTKDSSFGAGDSEIRVSKPLQMLPSLPRFARLNDTFKAGVLVSNNTDAGGNVEVSVQAQGLQVNGAPSKSVYVGARDEQEVLFDFRSPHVGVASLSFRAGMGGQKDGLKLSLPVHEPVATETVATTGTSDQPQTGEALLLESKPRTGVGKLTVTVSSSILSGLAGALDYIETYPYGCLEQRLTRIAPHLMLLDLLQIYRTQPSSKAELAAVQETLDKLGSFQGGGGGFKLWPDSTEVNQYLSIYAMDLMDRAKADGYRIDMTVYNAGRAYLKKIPSMDAEEFQYPYSESELAVVRAYALSVLARLGVKDLASYNNLYSEHKSLPLEARVHLLRAARLLKRPAAEQKTLQDELTSRIRLETEVAYFEEKGLEDMVWVYGSNVRITAMILTVLLEGDPKFQYAPQVTRWLLQKQTDGHWSNTQNDIHVLHALDLYHRLFEKENPNFKLTVKVDGKPILSETVKGRQAVLSQEVPADDLNAGKQAVQFDKSGPGRFYYTLRLKYAPSSKVPPRDEGFTILRQVVPVEGSPSSDPTLKAGQVYRVTLSIVTPQERHFVVVDDPVPAGAEVVQTSFATERDELRRALDQGSSEVYWGGGTFNHFEIHDDRVLLFADFLTAGEHTYQYLIRAGYPGTYDLPATRAEEMYHPEVFGTTPVQMVEIR